MSAKSTNPANDSPAVSSPDASVFSCAFHQVIRFVDGVRFISIAKLGMLVLGLDE